MYSDKPIIKVNDTNIQINQNTYSWNKRGIRNRIIETIKKDENATLRDVVRSALQTMDEKEFELLGDDHILDISKKILTSFNDRQYRNSLKDKIDEFENTIEKTKEQAKLDSQENESKNETNEGEYTTNENTLYQWINKEDYDSCAGMLIALSTEERNGLVDELLRRENGYEACIKLLIFLEEKDYKFENKENLISETYKKIPKEIRKDIFEQWIKIGEYSDCARMLELEESEQNKGLLRELLEQNGGYEKCVNVLFASREFKVGDVIYRKEIKSRLDKMIPEDTRIQISLDELCDKLKIAEKDWIEFLDMSEQEVPSEEIDEEELEEENYEEFIANINLEDFSSDTPVMDAIIKIVEIERHIEHDKDKNIDEEQQEQEDEESQQNEYDEDIDIDDNEDKDDTLEQLQSNVNQLMEELDQLNRQILEIDEEIKKCDNTIKYYYTSSELETIRETIREIEDKIILRNLSDDEEKELEQLKQFEAKLIQKLVLLRSNSTIPKFGSKCDLKKTYTSKALRKEELNPKSEELKTRRDEIEREIAEIEGKIAEITGTTAEKDEQNSERL